MAALQYKGDASLYRVRVYDGTNVVSQSSSTLTNSTDWTWTTVNYPCMATPSVDLAQTETGTGAAVKGITLGSTNTTSATAIKSGSGNIALNSGFTVDSTGRNYNTVQPAFLAVLSSSVSNVTGDGTEYTVIFDQEKFDQASNYNNTTGVFTAPITGKYSFSSIQIIASLTASFTNYAAFLLTTAMKYQLAGINPGAVRSNFNSFALPQTILVNMTAGDTAYVTLLVSGSTKTIQLIGNNVAPQGTYFSGALIC